MELLTRKPDQNTRNIVNKLAEICAPNMASNYPGDSLINLLGEMGILAGALEIETQIQGIQDLNNNLPITEKVLCERYDNTQAFRLSLMSNSIDPKLAEEILEEIENKKQEEFGYILDNITELAEGKILEKPQTAKQFYNDMISQVVDMEKNGKSPQSLSDLQIKKSGNSSIDVKKVLQQKIKEDAEKNVALQAMFDLTAESLFRPYRDRFRRDSENYIDVISTTIPYEKEVKKVQIIETEEGPKEVPTMEFLNIVNMDYIPAVKITRGNITIRPQTKEQKLYEAKAGKEEVLEKYKKVKDEYVENRNNITLAFLKFFTVGIFGLGVIDETIVGLIDAAISLFGEDADLAGDYENLNEDLKQWIEESFYPAVQDNLDNEYEYVITQLEQDLTPQQARAIKRNDDKRENREVIQEYKDKTKTFNEIFRSDQNLKDLLKHISYIKLYTPTDVFSTSGVQGAELEFKLIPSYLLPVSKKVGDKTVLMSKEPDFNFLRDTSKNYTISNIENMFPAPLDFYVSNGFVEENYSNQFLNPSDYNKKENTIIENKKEVGQKYRDALKLLSNDIQITVEDDRFEISISSRHSGSIANPLLDRVSDNSSIDYDSVVSDRLTKESLDCVVKSVGNPLNLSQEILREITRQLPPERQIIEAIPLWKIQYLENLDNNDQFLESVFSLQTTGLSFSPVGKYDNFYHDTVLNNVNQSTSREIESMLISKYGQIPGKFVAFKRYLGLDSEFLSQQLSSDSQFAIQLDFNNPSRATREEIYKQVFSEIKDNIVSMFVDNRLLSSVQQGEEKLIEMFDFTREQTDYEKENNLDPNIMNFVDLRQMFSELSNQEDDEELSDEQIKGEKGSENNITKSAKNVLLVSFVRLCINEYILKNIFIFDSLNFASQMIQMNLVIKDIANFVCQEAKRVGIGRELQKQSIRYYDTLITSGKIEQQEQVDIDMKLWKSSNSFSSVSSNPKMTEIVKSEFKNCLAKFSSLLNCDDVGEETDPLIEKIIELFLQKRNQRIQLGIETKATDIYVKKYARIPNLTDKGMSRLSNYDKQKFLEKQDTEVTIQELSSLLRQTNVDPQQFFRCDLENSLFDSPIAFGAKFIMETVGDQQNEQYDISMEEIAVNVAEVSGDVEKIYNEIYEKNLYPKLTTNNDTQIFFKYCLGLNELLQIMLSHSFLYHNDQDSRFIFEGTKMMISKMYAANMDSGDLTKTIDNINKMLEEQRRNEDNTGNPLGPALEALKFYYRTPIQILKSLATIVDPNIALADLIVKGGAMAGNLAGQQIDIPYSLASLSLLPFPLFNGVSPPIPPLTSYNVALPLGPIFLGLEPLLKDLPYYKNKEQGKLPTGDGKQNPYNNPLFCELSDEENEE
jgi:Fe-S-cluster formation regulator IscX/YfhJ